MGLRDLKELAALESPRLLVRIPPETDVPLTPRVQRLIDTSAFRRLSRISQLGLVSLVYPAAIHTRFEHALGVYRLALLLLKHLARNERFAETIDESLAERFVLAALLHDIGHWPFCHPLEDIRLPGVPRHEELASEYLRQGEIADCLREDWATQPAEVLDLLTGDHADGQARLLGSLLSGPIDIDKMDYLGRDSLHAGVPYGRNFDQGRLIASLCLNAAGDGLAVSDKGKTAAELLVFARYVMFSEVYWHHAVRAATGMLQRAFFLLYSRLDLGQLFRLTEGPLITELQRAAGDSPAGELLDGLFGERRRLYKRVAQYSFFEQREVYERLARRPYAFLAECAVQFVRVVRERAGMECAPHEVLFDAPPVEREVEFRVPIYYAKERRYRPLEEVSPVVKALAKEQFDDYVKRVRIFAHPRVAAALRGLSNLTELLHLAIDKLPG